MPTGGNYSELQLSDQRTFVEWQGGSSTDKAKVMIVPMTGRKAIRFLVQGGATVRDLDVDPLPAGLVTNTPAKIKGRISAVGVLSLYVDDAAVGTGAGPVDLAGGTLTVGSDHTGREPRQGYVSAAAACRNAAPLTARPQAGRAGGTEGRAGARITAGCRLGGGGPHLGLPPPGEPHATLSPVRPTCVAPTSV